MEFIYDSLHLIIEFTDGDGDFGIAPDDPNFPEFLDEDSTIRNPYYNNLIIDYYEKIEGKWILIETANPNGFDFRVPVLTPSGQNKQLEVTFSYDMRSELPYDLAESDTIKFGVTLVDRALNESIPEETEELIIPF